MAAALQKEMKVSMTEVATTTFVARPACVSVSTGITMLLENQETGWETIAGNRTPQNTAGRRQREFR